MRPRDLRFPGLCLFSALSLLACKPGALGDDGADGTDETSTETGDPGSETSETGDPTGDPSEGEEPECRSNADCPAYSYCEFGYCVSGEQPEPPECEVDDDCPEGRVCASYECIPSFPSLPACDPLELVATDLFALTYPWGFDVGDVDGQPGDEIVAYHQGEIVSIAAGVATISPHPVPYGGIRDAVILRADADAAPDLIVAGATGSSGLRIFLGDGAGGFGYLGARYFDFEVYRLAGAAASTRDALITGVVTPPELPVFVDALADAPTLTIPSESVPLSAALDGDAVDELVTVDSTEIGVWTRSGDSYAMTSTIDCAGGYGDAIPVLGDLDGDGLDDLICLTNADGVASITLWRNLGALEFAAQPTLSFAGSVANDGGHRTGLVADLDGDGVAELVLGGTFVRLGDDGNFTCAGDLGLESIKQLRSGDVDGDGRDELVAVDLDDTLQVLELP